MFKFISSALCAVMVLFPASIEMKPNNENVIDSQNKYNATYTASYKIATVSNSTASIS